MKSNKAPLRQNCILLMMLHEPCKQIQVDHVAVKSNLQFYLCKCIASMKQCNNNKSGMQAISCGKFHWFPWHLAYLVCCWNHQISTLINSVMYVTTWSEWIEAMGTIINILIVCSKCMPCVITAPLCKKFQMQIHYSHRSMIKMYFLNWRQSILINLTNAGSPSHGTLCTHYWRSWKGDVFPNHSTYHKYYRSTNTLVDCFK